MSKLNLDVFEYRSLLEFKPITEGGLGTEPPAAVGYRVWERSPQPWAIFRNFLEKNYFKSIGSHFVRIQSHLKVLHFQHLKAN